MYANRFFRNRSRRWSLALRWSGRRSDAASFKELRCTADRTAALLVRIERHPLLGPAGTDIHLLLIGGSQRRFGHRQNHPLDGPPLRPEACFHEAGAEMPGILGDDPAVIELDISGFREPGHGFGGPVIELVFAVERLHRAGEPDLVALGQGDHVRPVEREFPGFL